MTNRSFFFAGGGTGGHIYPAIAVAEQILKLAPEAKIHFFCSDRDIDERIFSSVGGDVAFEYTRLPAKSFSMGWGKSIDFCSCFIKSYRIAKQIIFDSYDPVIVGVGGYVAVPVCLAGYRLNKPIILLNVDMVPGRANRIISRWAKDIFVQFEDSMNYFAGCGGKVSVVGCPLRGQFNNPDCSKVIQRLKLDEHKRILLITGASSGSEHINEAICLLLDRISMFADDWQIVHLTGTAHFEKVKQMYDNAQISHRVLSYFDEMANLLASADLVVGRSGGVSVAEYAAAEVASICMPYPYHRDRHQYLNARWLAEAGAAVIVDDLPDKKERTEQLWVQLQELMKNEKKREEMAQACKKLANKQASLQIAQRLLKIKG